jgi:hypothetical protein
VSIACFVALCVYIYVFQKRRSGKLYAFVTETEDIEVFPEEIDLNSLDWDDFDSDDLDLNSSALGVTDAEPLSDYSDEYENSISDDMTLYEDSFQKERMAEVDMLIKEIGEENE